MAQPTQKPGSPPTEEMGAFGKIAIKLGYITNDQLEEAMKAQAAAAKAGLRKRLGEILIKKGYLTNDQFHHVLKSQTLSRKKIGDYELLSKLGEGGMGAVFKAKQTLMDRIVALKILSPKMAKNQEFRDRFIREARVVAKLNHPHIVTGIDVGSADGYHYFAMEFVDGESLGQYMHRKGGKLPEPVALEFVRQIALALQHAHENNLLHRDVKPDNVLLDKRFSTAKLADLGLARSSDEDDGGLTQAGQAVGTPFYISPEQARGKHDLTPATDLYSLGATLFHLLTGQVPFDGPTAAVIMTRHLTDPVPSLREINRDISPGAEKIVFKLMEKDPEDRYRDCKSLIADIIRVQEGESLDKDKKGGKAKAAARSAPPVIEREREREREREDTPNNSSAPVVSTRLRRRRRRTQVSTAGGAVIFILLLVVLLIIAKPWSQSSKASNTHEPQPPRREPPREQRDPPRTTPPPVVSTEPPPPPATAAVLAANAEGVRVYKTDFDTKLENWDVDPNIGRPNQFLKLVADKAGTNKVLRLASILPSNFLAKDSGAAARLLLPNDLVFNKYARLTFVVHFENYPDTPELKIWWDHKTESGQRAVAGWSFKDANFKGWAKVHAVLGRAQMVVPSKEPNDSPQFIEIFAGKPNEAVEAYIDDFELIDSSTPEAASQPAQEGEAPVAPRPAKKKAAPPSDAEPPVAPPPKKIVVPDDDAVRKAL